MVRPQVEPHHLGVRTRGCGFDKVYFTSAIPALCGIAATSPATAVLKFILRITNYILRIKRVHLVHVSSKRVVLNCY